MAAACGSQEISYAALNSLNPAGLPAAQQRYGHGDPVGIYVERSIGMLVALPAYRGPAPRTCRSIRQFPPERICFMMEDVELRVADADEYRCRTRGQTGS